MPLRRAGSVLLGCFVLFGARAIAAGLLVAQPAAMSDPPPAAPEPTYAQSVQVPAVYDPYAGASVPTVGSRPGTDLPGF